MSRLLSISSSEDIAPVMPHTPSRRAARLRARNTLLCCGLLWFLTTFIASIAIDFCPSQIRFLHLHWALQRVDRSGNAPAVVCFGSSRFAHGIRTDIVEQKVPGFHVVSGTLPAGDPITGELFLREMLGRGHVPKLLVIEVSPETVSPLNPFMDWHITREFSWPQIIHCLPDIYRSGSTQRLLYARLLPLYHHNQHFRRWLQSDWRQLQGEPPFELGSCDPTVPTEVHGPLDARPVTKWMRHYHTGGCAAEALDRMLAMGLEHHVPMVMVGVPVSSPHRAAYTAAVDEAYRSFINALSRKYRVDYVEARDWVEDAKFLDHHHLNYSGSVKFSQRLATDVVAPRIASSEPDLH